eukprot:Pgem_evm2s9109
MHRKYSNHLRARSEKVTKPDKLPEGINWTDLNDFQQIINVIPAGYVIPDFLELNPDIKDENFKAVWLKSTLNQQKDFINKLLQKYKSEDEQGKIKLEKEFNESFNKPFKEFLSNHKPNPKKAEKQEFNNLFFWHYLTNIQQEPRKRKRSSSPRKRKRKRSSSTRKRKRSSPIKKKRKRSRNEFDKLWDFFYTCRDISKKS